MNGRKTSSAAEAKTVDYSQRDPVTLRTPLCDWFITKPGYLLDMIKTSEIMQNMIKTPPTYRNGSGWVPTYGLDYIGFGYLPICRPPLGEGLISDRILTHAMTSTPRNEAETFDILMFCHSWVFYNLRRAPIQEKAVLMERMQSLRQSIKSPLYKLLVSLKMWVLFPSEDIREFTNAELNRLSRAELFTLVQFYHYVMIAPQLSATASTDIQSFFRDKVTWINKTNTLVSRLCLTKLTAAESCVVRTFHIDASSLLTMYTTYMSKKSSTAASQDYIDASLRHLAQLSQLPNHDPTYRSKKLLLTVNDTMTYLISQDDHQRVLEHSDLVKSCLTENENDPSVVKRVEQLKQSYEKARMLSRDVSAQEKKKSQTMPERKEHVTKPNAKPDQNSANILKALERTLKSQQAPAKAIVKKAQRKQNVEIKDELQPNPQPQHKQVYEPTQFANTFATNLPGLLAQIEKLISKIELNAKQYNYESALTQEKKTAWREASKNLADLPEAEFHPAFDKLKKELNDFYNMHAIEKTSTKKSHTVSTQLKTGSKSKEISAKLAERKEEKEIAAARAKEERKREQAKKDKERAEKQKAKEDKKLIERQAKEAAAAAKLAAKVSQPQPAIDSSEEKTPAAQSIITEQSLAENRKNKLNRLSVALQHLVRIHHIHMAYLDDKSYRDRERKAPEELSNKIWQCALLYNYIRTAVAFSQYHGTSVTQQDVTINLRNMLIHHGAGQVSQMAVLDSAPTFVETLSKNALRLHKPNTITLDLSQQDLSTMMEVFGLFKDQDELDKFALRPACPVLEDLALIRNLEKTPLYKELASHLEAKQDNNVSPKKVLDDVKILMPLILQIYEQTQKTLRQDNRGKNYFEEHFFAHIDALKMLLTMCGEYYYFIKNIDRTNDDAKEFELFMRYCHDNIRNPVGHRFPDCDFAVLIEAIHRMKQIKNLDAVLNVSKPLQLSSSQFARFTPTPAINQANPVEPSIVRIGHPSLYHARSVKRT